MSIIHIVKLSEFVNLAKALSSDSRVRIFELLLQENLNINEIATRLKMPMSSVALNVKKMEEVKLIQVQSIPGKRGMQKICTVPFDQINFYTNPEFKPIIKSNLIQISKGVGSFVTYSVQPTCGMVSLKKELGPFNKPASFNLPERIDAQLIWFNRGYLEYSFPVELPPNAEVLKIDFSAEICSETHLHNNDFPSDITIWMNNNEIGTWTSPGDFGGKRGKYTPLWWPSFNTQFGLLKHWIITPKGTYLDKKKIAAITPKDIFLEKQHGITLRIGIKPDAKNSGGINIFGKYFGNYNQDLNLEIEYRIVNEEKGITLEKK